MSVRRARSRTASEGARCSAYNGRRPAAIRTLYIWAGASGQQVGLGTRPPYQLSGAQCFWTGHGVRACEHVTCRTHNRVASPSSCHPICSCYSQETRRRALDTGSLYQLIALMV